MDAAKVNDLNFARVSQVAVDLRLYTGEKLLTGVHEVNEDEGYVSLYDPKAFGDSTTRKVELDAIVSIAVTNFEYLPPGSS